MKFRDVELLNKRAEISSQDKELSWSGNALRLLDGGGAQQAGKPAAARV